jgi:hypothetical protein
MRPVVATKINLKTPGGALDSTMAVAPQQWHTGDEVVLVMKFRVGAVAFPEHKKGDASEFDRRHDFHAMLATVIDESLVKEVLDKQRLAIQSMTGVEEFDFTDEEIAEQQELEELERAEADD